MPLFLLLPIYISILIGILRLLHRAWKPDQDFNAVFSQKMTDVRANISKTKIWQVIGASAVGTMIEWYDFYIFGSLTATIAPLFYPPEDQTFAYIAYLATFAVGFVVRPFGALLPSRWLKSAATCRTPPGAGNHEPHGKSSFLASIPM